MVALPLKTKNSEIVSLGQVKGDYEYIKLSPDVKQDVLFPISNRDDRLGPKEIVVGLENGGVNKAYNIQDVQKQKVINDHINNKSVALISLYPLMVRVVEPILEYCVFNYEFRGLTIGVEDITLNPLFC